MKIIEYEYKDIGEPYWNISKIRFTQLNLLVGLTASGKSRILNTIYNLFSIASGKIDLRNGTWKLKLSENGKCYIYKLKIEDRRLSNEELFEVKGTKRKRVFSRSKGKFIYLGSLCPKLDHTRTSISLLKEEKVISSIYAGFEKILRRNFFGPDLTDQLILQKPSIKATKDLDFGGFKEITYLNCRLLYLNKKNRKAFNKLVLFYKEIFPFISDIGFSLIKFERPGTVTESYPSIVLKEKGRNSKIRVDELSTGMVKVLIILTDLAILNNDSIYFIDEYENSLGDNAIDFLDEYLNILESFPQLFITSHHPHLINNIPIDNWYICHRDKTEIKVLSGLKLKSEFKKSHQDNFSQLLNAPFYLQGKE